MKTHHTISKNLSRTRVRLGMTLAGIATAIIGLVALFYEAPFMERAVNLPRIETAKIGTVNLPAAVSQSVVSAVWPF